MVPSHAANRRAALRVAVGVVLAGAAAIASWWPFWAVEAATGVVNVAVAVTFVATAALLYEDAEQRVTAWAIGSAAAFYLTSWWWAWPADWQVGPLPLISFLFGYLWWALGGLALVRYPNARLQLPVERVFFAVLIGWICGLKLLLAVTSQAAWAEFGERAWWPGLLPNRSVFDVGTTVYNGGLVVLTLGLLALLVAKIRRADRLEVVDAAPAVVAAATVALSGIGYLAARLAGVSDGVQDQLRIVVAIAALATPLAFLAAVLRRLLTRSAVAANVPRIARSALDEIQDELRRALWDPDLRLWFWRPAVDGFVRPDGSEGTVETVADRWLVEIPAGDGGPLAVIDTSRALQRHPDVVISLTHAVGLALERQAQLEEVHASRARINDAELAARRSIRRDLHDGVQQHLLTVKTRLRIASMRAPQSSQEAIEQAHDALEDALDAFGTLTRGSFPPILASGGLAAALPGIVARLDVDAHCRTTPRRFPPSIEEHLYTVVSEALTNVHKYARHAHATVDVEYTGGTITVIVADDGRGGADPARGTGLAGMADRIHALGGEFDVHSPRGEGTTIEVRLPCE